jgi:hypothetical protein
MRNSTKENLSGRWQRTEASSVANVGQSGSVEDKLTPIVRLALRRGVGAPVVVQWVRQTFDRLSEGLAPASAEHYVPQITRLLRARLAK